MKILFFVTGFGYGDSTRVHAVISEMLKKDPETRILIAGYDCSLNYFKGKFRTIKISGYRIPGNEMKFKFSSFIANNYLLPLSWLFTILKLKKQVRQFNPDIIVTDLEPSGITMARFFGKKCIALYGFDPMLYDEYASEHKPNRLMSMQAFYLKKNYSLSDYIIVVSPIRKKKSLIYNYVEPVVRIMPRELASEAKLMKELNLERRPVLVMLGGSNFGAALAKNIVKIAPDFNEFFIIFGSGIEVEKSGNVAHVPFTDDFFKYLKVSKGMITLAGQNALGEGLVFKKPMLVYPIHNHVEQQLNCYAIKDYIMIGRNIMPESLKKTVGEFISRIPAMRYDAAKLNLDSNGASQAADIILRLAKKK
ncbi:MAG: glycosyltransferase family protein [Nanoarchaeota archaeon]